MADPLATVDHIFVDRVCNIGTTGDVAIYPAYGPWYLMQGYVSGVPVQWKSRDPTVNTEYTAGPPYPSPFFVVSALP